MVCIVDFLCLYFQKSNKMTGNNTKRMSFENYFIMFWKYWDYTSKRGTDYNALKVVLLTNVLFMDLRTQQEKNGWDVEELKWICAALDHNYGQLISWSPNRSYYEVQYNYATKP